MCHRFLFGEILPQGFHNEVVVDTYHTVLGEKLGELGAVNRQIFVGGEYLEWLSEDELLDESGLDGHVGSLHHAGKLVPFGIVEPDFDAVVASVDQWRSSAFGVISHKKVDFVRWVHRGAYANGSFIEGYSTLEKYPA